jgi:hypothetical protein
MLTSRQPEPSPGDGPSPGDDPCPDGTGPGGTGAGGTGAGEIPAGQPPAWSPPAGTTPMTSIQMSESPEDAEAHSMADQRPADRATLADRGPEEDPGAARGNARVQPDAARGTAKVQPDRARGAARVQPEAARGAARVRAESAHGSARVHPGGPGVADVQTSSGVPPTPIAAPGDEPAADAQNRTVEPGAPVRPQPTGAQAAVSPTRDTTPPGPAPQTPAPQTPAPQTPAPQTPAPQTPAPQTPGRPQAAPPAAVRARGAAGAEARGAAGAEARGTASVPVRIVGKAAPDATSMLSPTVTPPPAVVEPTQIPVVPGRPGARRPAPAPAADRARPPKAARGSRAPLDLGHAPVVLAISALGVLLVAFAYQGGRAGWSGSTTAYWIGQIVVFTPVVVRLLSRRMAGVAESFLLVMGLAVNQYLLKWMYSPDQLRFPDELQHWLATTVLIDTGELFQRNHALPPAVHFPALAEMAAALASMTGMTVTASGIVVAGVAHLVFVGALFMAALRASRSPAVAGVACALYATAMHYLFFNSMFLYQTAALPFFMLTIWATRRWLAGSGWPFAFVGAVCIAVTTVSHHVTALTLVPTLFLLAVAELVTQRPRRPAVLVLPVISLVLVAAWILLVANDVIGYLEDPVKQVWDTLSLLVSDSSSAASTSAAVSVGQLIVQGAGLLGLFVLYLACVRDMIHRHDRDAWRWAAVAGSFVFFAGNGVRFLGQNGPEISGRLQTFTYVPIAILVAVALVRGVQIIPLKDAEGHRWRAAAPAFDYPAEGGWHLWARVAAGSALITLLMIGARAGGWPPIGSILPGPYLAGGYERSVDAYGVAAANWQRTTLGPDNRVGGDLTSVSLASTYGRQDPVRDVAPLYYATEWGLSQDDMVARLHLRYLVVDRRLSTQLPESGAYFEDDPQAGKITVPLSRVQIGKFDTLTDVDRLYDNGNVRIYRMGDE